MPEFDPPMTPEMYEAVLKTQRINTFVKAAATVACFYIFFGMPKGKPVSPPQRMR
jgi:hypothetical protein